MVEYTATVGGSTVEGVVSVTTSKEREGELGTAEITCENIPKNRGYEYGAIVEIFRGGSKFFEGVLSAKPQGPTRGLTLTLKARDRRRVLSDTRVSRPFYNVDSGAAIREAVQSEAVPRDAQPIFLGEDTSGFSTTVPVFGLADLPELSLNSRGSDLFYVHFPAGSSGEFALTFEDVPTSIDDPLLWFETRTLFNNSGGLLSAEVEFRPYTGESYLWDLPLSPASTPRTRRLNAEEADPDGDLSTDGTVEFRFSLNGTLPESRAGVIDYARTRTFGLSPRNRQLSVENVEDTGRRITRRFDTSLLDMTEQLAVEDNAISRVEGDSLYYQSGANTTAPDLSYASTQVLSVDIDRDASGITNRVVAQGAGDLQRTYEATDSVKFYGPAPKSTPLIDKSIQTEDELTAFAEGYLRRNAWTDSAISFTVFEEKYRDVKVGQVMSVSWDEDGISGTYSVTSVSTDSAGRITIGLSGHTGTQA